MKKILKNTINTIRGNLSLKKLLALTLGVGLLASSFLLGMTFEGRDKSKSAQAYEAENEKTKNAQLYESENETEIENSSDDTNSDNQDNNGQEADATSSATLNTSNPDSAYKPGTNMSGTSGNSSIGSSGTTSSPIPQIQQYTIATLASFNGKNGAKAYIAYNGKVYDVTNSSSFVNGVHKYDSSVKAGTDITSQMDQAPSSHTTRNYIATLPQVGVLVAVITNTSAGVSSPTIVITPATTIAPIGDDDEEEEEDDDD